MKKKHNMEVIRGSGTTEFGPGVDIKLKSEEVAAAISAYLVAHGVHIDGPRTITVNKALIKEGNIYVDPAGSVISDGIRISGHGTVNT